jgi:hypothetical protein
VAELQLGAQIEAEWLPLTGIADDQEAVLLKSLEVIDEDGVRQIIELRDPLMLPPPEMREKWQRGDRKSFFPYGACSAGQYTFANRRRTHAFRFTAHRSCARPGGR